MHQVMIVAKPWEFLLLDGVTLILNHEPGMSLIQQLMSILRL